VVILVSRGLPRGVILLRTELEDPISGGVWKIKTGGAFSSRNIPFQK